MKPKFIETFLPISLCEQHSKRMDVNKYSANKEDHQSLGAWSWYGLHWDLLEECCDKMSQLTGLRLIPSYDYSRIYIKGNVLKPHKDRPSCEISATINLKNVGPMWEFCWTGGSCLMGEGDAVLYNGPSISHWRDTNPADYTYQVFLHYVDADGPHSAHGNEYMKRRGGTVKYKDLTSQS